MDGAEINKSLLALKECIRALGGADEYGAAVTAPNLTLGYKCGGADECGAVVKQNLFFLPPHCIEF